MVTGLAAVEYAERQQAEAGTKRVGLGFYPRQQIAFDLLLKVDRLGYGGAAGGGKDAFAIRTALMFASHFPGLRAAFFRRKEDDLRSTMVPETLALLPRDEQGKLIGCRWIESRLTLEFDNGTRFEFLHAKEERSVEDYKSHQWHLLIVNEATEFTRYQIEFLLTRVRSAASGIPTKVILLTNPGSEGHAWFKEWFITGREPERVYETPVTIDLGAHGTVERTVKSAFVPSFVWDNPALWEGDPNYVASLHGISDPVRRRQLLYGDWDFFEGAFFSTFARHTHVIEPDNPPPHWRKWRALDFAHGGSDPSVCLWFTADPDTGRVIVYRELRERQLTWTEFKRRVVSMSADDGTIDYTVADYSGKARTGDTGISVWDVFAADPNPIILQPASKARDDGWARIKDLLANLKDGKPGLQVMQHCVWTIREFANAVTHPKNNRDLADPTKNDDRRDDALDCVRYGVMSRIALPVARDEDPTPERPRLGAILAGRGR